MARLMAFDYGSKRLGIAVSDPLKIIATSLKTIHPKDIIVFLKDYLSSEEIELFIIGEPFQMDGTHSDSEKNIKTFINILKKNFPEIPIVRQDERFTSKMAEQTIIQSGLKKSDRAKKGLVDTISAVIILQSFMNKQF